MKVGAVEALRRRVGKCPPRRISTSKCLLSGLDALEDAVFLQNTAKTPAVIREGSVTNTDAASVIREGLELLLEHLQAPLSQKTQRQEAPKREIDQATDSRISESLHSAPAINRNKRRRVQDSAFREQDDLMDLPTNLPPGEILDAVIDLFFSHLQPWIPIFHEKRFRRRINDAQERYRLQVVLQAMVVAVLKHLDCAEMTEALGNIESICEQYRRSVILTAMDGLYVENLQALVIICFEDVWPPHSSPSPQPNTPANHLLHRSDRDECLAHGPSWDH